jgi:anti-sigma B factor antagonist
MTDTPVVRAPHFHIQATSTGDVLVLEVSGDLDALTAPHLAEAITASLAEQTGTLIVDLSKLDFLASAGMGVLIAGNHAANVAQQFGVVADGPITARPMKLVGLDGILLIYPTLDAALADNNRRLG